MPTMGSPYRAFPGATPADMVDGGSSGVRSVRLRLHTALHRGNLTRALAEGADPKATDELALRAQQLTSQRTRRTLARSLRRLITEAHQPPMTRVRLSIIDRRAVLDAEAAITSLIERLRSASPVQPQGVALLTAILTNVDDSPLYNASEAGALRRKIRSTTAALDVTSARSHEFPLTM